MSLMILHLQTGHASLQEMEALSDSSVKILMQECWELISVFQPQWHSSRFQDTKILSTATCTQTEKTALSFIQERRRLLRDGFNIKQSYHVNQIQYNLKIKNEYSVS